MSAGIAQAGMHWRRAEKPVPLPAQALDHGTGYLVAAAVVRGVTRRVTNGGGLEARLSLARTAKFLADAQGAPATAPLAPETPADLSPDIEPTTWGPARRIASPIAITAAPMSWDRPAGELGTSAARWEDGARGDR
jgi:hypothetical protein